MKNQPNAEIKWYKQAMLNHQTKKPTSKQTKEWTCIENYEQSTQNKNAFRVGWIFFF